MSDEKTTNYDSLEHFNYFYVYILTIWLNRDIYESSSENYTRVYLTDFAVCTCTYLYDWVAIGAILMIVLSRYVINDPTGLFISFHTLEMSCFWWAVFDKFT